MSLINLGYAAVVPANSSRFFIHKADAIDQPMGTIELVYDEIIDIVKNSAFDSELIKYDDMYCTSVSNVAGEIQLPTKSYFSDVISILGIDIEVVEIGCGQGEFVGYLQDLGIRARGYDPALVIENSCLKKSYWSKEFEPANLYVMRCVLPHIPDPWEFIYEIFEVNINAKVLIEFQDLHWILDNHIWWQVSHDHVNVFSISDFATHFNIVTSGSFANGEWSWVVIEKRDPISSDQESPLRHDADKRPPRSSKLQEKFQSLSISREVSIRKAREISQRGDFAIWGAAGKGIVLASTLIENGITNFIAIDADQKRWGKYLECSGVQVYSGVEGIRKLNSGANIIVSNPNHLKDISEFVGKEFELGLITSQGPQKWFT